MKIIAWMGVTAIVVGILVLVFPDLIRWLIGIGLIVLGILALTEKWLEVN